MAANLPTMKDTLAGTNLPAKYNLPTIMGTLDKVKHEQEMYDTILTHLNEQKEKRLDPLITYLNLRNEEDKKPQMINDKEIVKYLPSVEWIMDNKDDIVKKIQSIHEGGHKFFHGDLYPWDDRSKLNQILKNIKATELTKYLLSSDIMPKTDDVETTPLQYNTHELLSAIVETSQLPLDEANDKDKGKVLLFLMAIRYLDVAPADDPYKGGTSIDGGGKKSCRRRTKRRTKRGKKSRRKLRKRRRTRRRR